MRITKITAIIILSMFSVFALSCKKKHDKMPSGVINKEKMIDILVDVNLLESAVRASETAGKQDSIQGSEFYKAIFIKHKITKLQFDNSIQYYSKRPEKFGEIYDEVINRLTRMQTEESSKK